MVLDREKANKHIKSLTRVITTASLSQVGYLTYAHKSKNRVIGIILALWYSINFHLCLFLMCRTDP